MTEEFQSPPSGKSIEIKLERCWQQSRDGGELFYKVPFASLQKVPPSTMIIFPNLVEYAIIPLEDYRELLQAVKPKSLSERMKHFRANFLRWLMKKGVH